MDGFSTAHDDDQRGAPPGPSVTHTILHGRQTRGAFKAIDTTTFHGRRAKARTSSFSSFLSSFLSPPAAGAAAAAAGAAPPVNGC